MNDGLMDKARTNRKRSVDWVAVLACATLLGACAQAPTPVGFPDKYEAQNRKVHEFNKSIDRAILKPLSGGEGGGLPKPVSTGIANVSRNLAQPSDVVNNLLQGRPHHALENTLRFALNSTIGLAGLFDPATAMGIPGKPTDFGETLHVWGAGEGHYLEVVVIGPTTERDLFGKVVDVALNPWGHVLPVREANAVAALRLAGKFAARSDYSDTVDSILYDSADSYAQTRLLYLQNRRFTLGQTEGEAADEGFIDPYEDPYGN